MFGPCSCCNTRSYVLSLDLTKFKPELSFVGKLANMKFDLLCVDCFEQAISGFKQEELIPILKVLYYMAALHP